MMPVRSKQQMKEQTARSMKRQLRAQRHKYEQRPPRRRVPSPFALPVPGWNERRMTIKDFNAACARERIMVYRIPFSGIKGCYLRMRGMPVIFIDSALRGRARLAVSFHELGHYFMHTQSLLPVRRFQAKAGERTDGGVRDWREVEADACAAIALKPRPPLKPHLRKLVRALAAEASL